MSANVQRKTWVRVSATLTSVRNNASDAASATSITVPIRGWIRRFRADITAGTGTPTITSFVSETSTATGAFDKVLTYTTATDPLDAEEDPGVFYSISASTTDGNRKSGLLYLNAITSDSTADHTVALQIDIEPAA
jgi:hypothetical protein